MAELAAVAAAGEREASASGRPIRGHVLPITRAASGGQSTATLGSGGALVSDAITLAQALQPVLMLERLGARRVEGRAGDLVVGAPTAVDGYWLGEDADAPSHTAMFGTALREPKEAAVRLRMSRNLFKQAGAVAEQELRGVLQRSMAATIEKGIINGSGANAAPMGLLQDPLLERRTFTSSTALPTRARVGELVAEVAENGADVDSVSVLLSSADYGDGQSGTPVVEIAPDGRRRLAGVPVAFSPYVPTGNVIIADWSRVSISYVGAPQLIIDPYTNGEQGILNMTLFQLVSYAVERRELLTVATLEA